MNTDSMLANVRLRTATIEDAELLSTLGARLFVQTFGPMNSAEDMAAYLSGAFTPARQAAELREPARITWIAENDSGTPVGYAVLIRQSTNESVVAERPAELRRIYADASWHGRSVDENGRPLGQVLLDRCVEQAREWGSDVLWLAVWERNPRALRFYEKHGFQKVGRTTFQLGADIQHDFVMARNL